MINVGTEQIGIVIGETTPARAVYLSFRPPRLGEYVLLEHPEGTVLGMVEESLIGNVFLPEDAKDIAAVMKTVEMLGEDRLYLKGAVRILTRLEDILAYKRVKPVKTPPKPGARVFEAGDDVLRRIFTPRGRPVLDGEAYVDEASGRGYVRIGALANNPNVPVYVDVTKMVARHTAILAMTGAGKSNTVAVLADRISRAFGGTVVIFDFHGEYVNAFSGRHVNVVRPRINPNTLKLYEIATLSNILPSYHKQYRVLRILYDLAYNKLGRRYQNRNLMELMVSAIDEIEEYLERAEYELSSHSDEKRKRKNPKERAKQAMEMIKEEKGEDVAASYERLLSVGRDRLYEVAGKLEDVLQRYKAFLSVEAPSDICHLVIPGMLNVVDLSDVDREGSDVFVAYVARSLLDNRKRYVASGGREGYRTPVFLVLEEAHILVPRGNEETNTKRVFAQIAREGRKFGVGVCLVSQRPKNIDENSLSQTSNKIILRLIEPEDQRYVQKTSEQLSDELLGLLTSLDVGEAILLGEFVMIPTLVKVDEHGGKTLGRDPEIVREWLSSSAGSRHAGWDIYDEFARMQYEP